MAQFDIFTDHGQISKS